MRLVTKFESKQVEKKRKIKGDDPFLNYRKPMKGERTVRVHNEAWGFKVGHGSVVIVNPDGRKVTAKIENVGHVQGDDFIVATGDVVDYIEANLLREYSGN